MTDAVARWPRAEQGDAVLIEATGPRSAEQVWRLYTHPSTWPTWAPQISSVHGVADPIGSGDRGVVHGPLLLRVPFVIEAVDDSAHRWTWRVGVGPLAVVLDHGVDQLPTGCRAWAEVHAPYPLVLPYSPFARLALRRLAGG